MSRKKSKRTKGVNNILYYKFSAEQYSENSSVVENEDKSVPRQQITHTSK